MSFTYDNKYKPNRTIHKIEKERLQLKKQVSAHQKAPLDYISPWQSHHQQIYLMQNHNCQNLPLMGAEEKHSVVNAFLEKIRRSSKNYKKNKNIIIRNMTVGQQILSSHSRKGQKIQQKRLQSALKKKYSQSITKNYTQSTNFQNEQTDDQLQKQLQIKGVKDVGFGLLEYSKISERQNALENKQSKKMLKKSVTSYNSKNSFSSHAYYTHYNKESQNKNTDLKNFLEITQVNLSTKNINMNRLFTDDQRKKPTQVVFIKKKKCSNKAAVVDINSTTQQFYQDQIRAAQQQMINKYRKLAPKKQIDYKRKFDPEHLGGSRYQTRNASQGQDWNKKVRHRKIQKNLSHCYDNTQILFNQELMRKKYSFLEQLKDKTLGARIQNMMRQHPSLAQSILISK